jgi:NAD-dependent SIR2 family protein deacetylase
LDHQHRTVPVDENGEILEMQGDLNELRCLHYGGVTDGNSKRTEREQRQ